MLDPSLTGLTSLDLLQSFLPFWILKQGIEHSDFALNSAINVIDETEFIRMTAVTRKHLNACCKDLLYIPGDAARVEFLHRSIFDFLDSGEMSRLFSRNVPDFFNHEDFVFHINLSCLKVFTDHGNLPYLPFNPKHFSNARLCVAEL